MCSPLTPFFPSQSDALAADIQTIPGLPSKSAFLSWSARLSDTLAAAPGYLNVDVDSETGEIDGLF